MKRFVEGQDRSQLILLPDCLDDYVGEDNPVRIVDAFIDELDLAVLGFAGVIPEATGRPWYHPVADAEPSSNQRHPELSFPVRSNEFAFPSRPGMDLHRELSTFPMQVQTFSVG